MATEEISDEAALQLAVNVINAAKALSVAERNYQRVRYTGNQFSRRRAEMILQDA